MDRNTNPAQDGIKSLPPAEIPFKTSEKTSRTRVQLWPQKTGSDPSLRLLGKIGEVEVAGFLRRGTRGAFVAFAGKKQNDGNYSLVATANVVSNVAGIPKLRMVMAETNEVLWVDISFRINPKILVEMGLDVKRQTERREAYFAQKQARKNSIQAQYA